MERDLVTPEDLQRLMERRQWNQAELADEMNVAASVVSRWMTGVRTMGRANTRQFRLLESEDVTRPHVTRGDIGRIIDDLPDEALPLVAAMLRGLAGHYRGRG